MPEGAPEGRPGANGPQEAAQGLSAGMAVREALAQSSYAEHSLVSRGLPSPPEAVVLRAWSRLSRGQRGRWLRVAAHCEMVAAGVLAQHVHGNGAAAHPPPCDGSVEDGAGAPQQETRQ